MQHWKERLCSLGRVAVFDYPYLLQGRRRPDPQAQLIAAHRCALTEKRLNDEPVVLIGKSMGGRIGCHLALIEKVSGLVCLSYPLCGGGDPGKLRDKVLRDLTTPILFVQGTRDPLCPLELLETIRSQMKAPNVLHVVEGADHSLLLRKTDLAKMGKSQSQIEGEIVEVIARFVSETLSQNDIRT